MSDSEVVIKIENICNAYNIGLCYLFGSQVEIGKDLLEGKIIEVKDPESDIDFAVAFLEPPVNNLKAYAALSLDIQDLVSPHRADLLFLHEVDHIIQLEAIEGVNVYSSSDEFRESYEELVMMFASDEMEVFKLNEKDMFEAIENGYFEFEYKAPGR